MRRSEEQSQLPSLQIRRQIVRLANLSVVLMLRRLSSGVAKRFPTYQHLVQVAISCSSCSSRCLLRHLRATYRQGFSLERSWLDWIRCRRWQRESTMWVQLIKMEKSSALSFADCFCTDLVGPGFPKNKHKKHKKTWKILWAQATLRKARSDGLFHSDFLYKAIHEWEMSFVSLRVLTKGHLFSDLRDINLQHANLICYAWINIPLVYTQVGERIEFTWCLCPSDLWVDVVHNVQTFILSRWSPLLSMHIS